LAGKAFGKSANPALVVRGNAFGKSMSPAPVVIAAPAVTDGRTGMVDLKAPGLSEAVVLASGAGPSPAQKKAPPPECGAR